MYEYVLPVPPLRARPADAACCSVTGTFSPMLALLAAKRARQARQSAAARAPPLPMWPAAKGWVARRGGAAPRGNQKATF